MAKKMNLKKRKMTNQIFKLEERVLFDGAAAAEIVQIVNNAGNPAEAQDDAEDTEKSEKEQIKNAVSGAGPIDTPDADATIQDAGKGLDQLSEAAADPTEALADTNTSFPEINDILAGENSDILSVDLNTVQDNNALSLADAMPEAENDVLIVIDSDAADDIDLSSLDGKNVLVLDGESDAGDQINSWLDEHDDITIDSVKFISDSDADSDADSQTDSDAHLLDSQDIEGIQTRLSDNGVIEQLSSSEFNAGLSAENSEMIIFPDTKTEITIDDTAMTPDADAVPEELQADADTDRHELVILNSTTADLDNVLEQLGDSREILIIDSTSETSALDQIDAYLNEHADTKYDAIHIMTHGNDEGFYLGNGKVTDAHDLVIFDGHLTDQADFMLYGCNTTSTDTGRAFVQSIADVTGADVAASCDITGAAAVGGNWILETNIGNIETQTISLDASWNYRLAAITIDGSLTADKYTATSVKTFQEALAGWNYTVSEVVYHYTLQDGDTVTFTNTTSVAAANVNVSISITGGSLPFASLTIGNGTTKHPEVTLSGGIVTTLTVNEDSSIAVSGVQIKEDITLNGGTITGDISAAEGTTNVDLVTSTSKSKAELTFNGIGDLTLSGTNLNQVENSSSIITFASSGKLNVTNSTFTGQNFTTPGNNNDHTSNFGTAITIESTASTATIKGGTFSGFNTAIDNAGSATSIKDNTGTQIVIQDNIYGIKNSGTITVSNAKINYNYEGTVSAPSGGAGIHNTSDGTITDISGITATGNYYGIQNEGTITTLGDDYDPDDDPISTSDVDSTFSNSLSSGVYNTGTIETFNKIKLYHNGTDKNIKGIYTTNGGGLYNSGTITIFANVEIINNHGDIGGGIYNIGNIAEGNNGVSKNIYISGNGATQGGGIYWGDGSFLKTDALVQTFGGSDRGIQGNSANQGGGIYIDDSTQTVLFKDFTFQENTAEQVNLKENMGLFYGGGVYISSQSKVIFDNVVMDGNVAETAKNWYNPDYWKYYYNDEDLEITTDKPTTYTGGRGGGVYSEGTLTVLHSEFKNNQAKFDNTVQIPDYYAYLNTLAMGGAIYSTGTLNVKDSYIHHNSAGYYTYKVNSTTYTAFGGGLGGGIYLGGGTATIESTEALNGLIWSSAGASDTQNSMIISENNAVGSSNGYLYAAGGFGGGIYADASTKLTINSTTIASNTASLRITSSGTTYDVGRGGGLYFGTADAYHTKSLGSAPSIGTGTLTIDGTARDTTLTQDVAELESNRRTTNIYSNTAASGSGLYILNGSTASIHNTEIYTNVVASDIVTDIQTAQDFFKAFIVSSNQKDESVDIKPSDVEIAGAGKVFTASGTGAYLSGKSTINLENVSIYKNNDAASLVLGGGIYVSGYAFDSSAMTHLNLVNTTLYANEAAVGGGLYIAENASVNVLDTTIAGNTASQTDLGGGIYIIGSNAEVNILNSIVVGNTASSTDNDVASESDASSIQDMYSLFGVVKVKNTETQKYENVAVDPTSNVGISVANIFDGGTLTSAWTAGDKGTIVYSKDYEDTTHNKDYYYNYAYATTHTLAISATGAAAYKGAYTAIDLAASVMYLNTLNSQTVAKGETTGTWYKFKDSTKTEQTISTDKIVTKGQNGLIRQVDSANGISISYNTYNIGAYQLEVKDVQFYDLFAENQIGNDRSYARSSTEYRTFTDSGEYYARTIVNTNVDTVNPYDGSMSLREAILMAGTDVTVNYKVDPDIYGDTSSAKVISEKFHFGTEIVFANEVTFTNNTLTIGEFNVYGTGVDGNFLTSSFYDSIGLNKSLQDANGNDLYYRIVAGFVDQDTYDGITIPETSIQVFKYDATSAASYQDITLTIQVAGDANGDQGRFRLFDAISGDITLYSGAAGSLTVSGGNVSNDSNPNRPSSERTSESLDNFGGVLRVSGSNAKLTLQNVTVQDGIANQGGGVYVSAGTLNLFGTTTLTNNKAQGFKNASDAVDLITYEDNTTSYMYTSGQGGAIYMAGGNLVIGMNLDETQASEEKTFIASTINITGNTAKFDGGAIYLDGSSTMTSNFALYDEDNAAITEAFNLSGNSATNGAGLYIATTGAVTLERANISSNTLTQGMVTNKTTPTVGIADSHGGGIYVASTAVNVTLKGVTISGNVTDSYTQPGSKVNPGVPDYVVSFGGGIYTEGTVNITASDLKTSSASGASNNYQTTTISDNKAINGGGIYAADGTLTFTDSFSESNTVTPATGGFITGNTATFGTYAKESSNTTGQGGGIYVKSGATVNLDNVNISGNTAEDGSSDNADVNTNGNNMSGRGGGVYTEGTFTMTNSIPYRTYINIEENDARSGGGVFQDGGTTDLSYLAINNNDASGTGTPAALGSAVYVASGTLTTNNITIAANTGNSNGTAVYIAAGTVTLTNTTVGLNSTIWGLYNVGGTLSLYNTIVVGNGSNGMSNIQGTYTATASIVGDATEYPTYTAALIFGTNTFSSYGTIALNADSSNPASTGGALYENETQDQLGNDRTKTPGSDVYSVGAVVGEGTPGPEPTPTGEYKVNTFEDDTDSSNEIYSLREVINLVQDGTLESVEFDWDALSDEGGWIFKVENGSLNITGNISIDAANQKGQTISIGSDALEDSVFTVTGTLTLANLTVNGSGTNETMVDADGAAIKVVAAGAALVLTNVTITGSNTTGNGAIYNAGTVTVTDTIFTGNSAATNGGAIYNAGTVTVTDTTFRDNSAINGGAIYNAGSTTAIYTDTATTVYSGNTANEGAAIYAAGDLTINGSVKGNTSEYGSVIYAAGDVTVTGSVNGNTETQNVIRANSVTVNGDISSNTASADVISAAGDVTVTGRMTDNSGANIISANSVTVDGSVSGNTASADVISATGDVTVTGAVNGNTETQNVISANSVTVDGSVSGNTASADVIYAAGDVTINGTVTGNTAGKAIVTGTNVYLNNTTVSGNSAANMIKASEKAVVINSLVVDNDNTALQNIISAKNATILNATISGTPSDESALVTIGDHAQIVNSVVASADASVAGVTAGTLDAAYSIFSGETEVNGVDDNNLVNTSVDAVLDSKYHAFEGSAAAAGVWVTYDGTDVYYSTRPDMNEPWTNGYKAWNMQWNHLGNKSGILVQANLLTSGLDSPSIGAVHGHEDYTHPDFGSGINSDFVDSSDNGIRVALDGRITGSYADLYSSFTGSRSDMPSLSVVSSREDIGGVPNGEEIISVESVADEEFEEFVTEPYYDDGTPLTESELKAIRTASLRDEVPEESVTVNEEVDQDVAESLRNADLFKDSFDKALDELLGLNA